MAKLKSFFHLRKHNNAQLIPYSKSRINYSTLTECYTLKGNLTPNL